MAVITIGVIDGSQGIMAEHPVFNRQNGGGSLGIFKEKAVMADA